MLLHRKDTGDYSLHWTYESNGMQDFTWIYLCILTHERLSFIPPSLLVLHRFKAAWCLLQEHPGQLHLWQGKIHAHDFKSKSRDVYQASASSPSVRSQSLGHFSILASPHNALSVPHLPTWDVVQLLSVDTWSCSSFSLVLSHLCSVVISLSVPSLDAFTILVSMH